MRILFYSPVSLRNGAGAEQWQMAVAKEIKALGHEIEIVACNYGAKNLTAETVKQRLKGVKYTELAVRTLPGGIALPTAASLAQLEAVFQRVDKVHYVFGFMGHDRLISRLGQKYQVSIFAGFHAEILTASTIHNLYVRTISRYLTLPHCQGFFVFNPDQAQTLTSWRLNQPAEIIAGGIDTDRFVIPKTARSTKKMEILFVGRMDYDKGADILFAALGQWLRSNPKLAHINLVGSGEFEDQAKELASQYPALVSYHPFTSDTVPYFSLAHLSLLPSRQETFGIAMIEALSTGIPVIVGPGKGPSRIITKETGWIVNPLTKDSLAIQIDQVYQQWKKDPTAWSKWQKATRDLALQYNPQKIAQKVVRAFIADR